MLFTVGKKREVPANGGWLEDLISIIARTPFAVVV